MSMIIPEFGTLQMTRSSEQHFGQGKVQAINGSMTGVNPVSSVKGLDNVSATSSAAVQGAVQGVSGGKSFQDYLLEAVNTVNSQQMDVTRLQEKVITSPDEVDIHDVTIAMSKARMSLNLAQSVIDRMITGWNEITTTR